DMMIPDSGPDLDARLVGDARPNPDSGPDLDARLVGDARPNPDSGPDPDSGPNPDSGPDPDSGPPPLGALRRLEGARFFELEGLPNALGLLPRRVRVYVPPGYDDEPARRYPVLYAHDGQNLFYDEEAAFGASWRFHATSDALILAGRVEPFILVAIDNTNERIWDYTGSTDPDLGGGGAEVYLTWLVETLRPAVEGHLRAARGPEHTGIMGSSLGGIVSLYALMRWPEVFGRVGVVSPSVWWDNRRPLEWAASISASPRAGTRIWLDNGTEEGDDSGFRQGALPHGLVQRAVNVQDMRRALSAGYPFGAALGYLEDFGGHHNEPSWAGRLEHILTFLWGQPDLRQPLGVRLRVERAPIPLNGHAAWAVEAYYPEITLTIPPEAGLISWSLDAAALQVEGDMLRGLAPGRTALTAQIAGVSDTLGLSVAPDEARAWALIRVWTPAVALGESVYVTGDREVWGPWAPDGQRLTYDGEAWRGLFALTPGAFEYKLTRGTWETVEKAADGAEAPNRQGALGGEGGLFEGEVQRWADQ
ncbi:hypothetical protein KKB55_02620, partial [Myxococcota bacterium]|nr:hypothetical protein [Myxococcota bacterium]